MRKKALESVLSTDSETMSPKLPAIRHTTLSGLMLRRCEATISAIISVSAELELEIRMQQDREKVTHCPCRPAGRQLRRPGSASASATAIARRHSKTARVTGQSTAARLESLTVSRNNVTPPCRRRAAVPPWAAHDNNNCATTVPSHGAHDVCFRAAAESPRDAGAMGSCVISTTYIPSTGTAASQGPPACRVVHPEVCDGPLRSRVRSHVPKT